MFRGGLQCRWAMINRETNSQRPPASLYTAATEDPSSQAHGFSDALVELCDGIVSQLGDAVIPAPKIPHLPPPEVSPMSLGSEASWQARGV